MTDVNDMHETIENKQLPPVTEIAKKVPVSTRKKKDIPVPSE